LSAVSVVLDRLNGVKLNGSGWIARCPAHDDRTPSLSVAEGDDGRVLLRCHRGCETEAILAKLGLELRDLFAAEGEGGGSTPQTSRRVVRLVRVDGKPVDQTGGPTLEALAEAKRLPVELLAELGCETVRYSGPAMVQIPYGDESGDVVGNRYRLALTGDARFRWRKGTKAAGLLYGASRLYEARAHGFVVLVEGESDVWTLLHHGIPAVGVPGANLWSDQHVSRLDGIETVFVVAEADNGGETLLASLRESPLRPRVRVIRLAA
jgi:hypothetical protein